MQFKTARSIDRKVGMSLQQLCMTEYQLKVKITIIHAGPIDLYGV